MPPDSRADGPCGPKARRTRGPASPGQRTAQPFGGTLNASPLRCASGASVSRGRSAGTPQATAHAGHRPHAGVRRPTRAAVHAGHRPSRGGSATHAGHRTRGTSVLAGVRQASRRLPHTRGIGPTRAFRGPCGPPYTRGIGPRGRSAGLPPPAAHAGHRPSRPTPPSQAFPTPPAARARPHPPAARFSRKPPCGIGSRMVYCT